MTHVYLATGTVSGVRVMKIGKANNLRIREKQIGIKMQYAWKCSDQTAAFALESQLRNFWQYQGCLPYERRKDWFMFDQKAYDAMLDHMNVDKGTPTLQIQKLTQEALELKERERDLNGLYQERLLEQIAYFETQLAKSFEERLKLAHELGRAEGELKLWREGWRPPTKVETL